MLTPIEKVAIFLLLIGADKGQRIINLMDTSEINAVVPEIRKLTTLSPQMQQSVWSEFLELGYEETMQPIDVLTIMRFLLMAAK